MWCCERSYQKDSLLLVEGGWECDERISLSQIPLRKAEILGDPANRKNVMHETGPSIALKTLLSSCGQFMLGIWGLEFGA